MPQVNKQVPPKQPAAGSTTSAGTPKRTTTPTKTVSKSGLLARAKPLADSDLSGIKVCLYGRAKTGKTRLVSTFPKPIVIIGAEDGTRSIRGAEGIDFVRLLLNANDANTLAPKGNYILIDELPQYVEELKTSGYATVSVDTASVMADMILANILGLDRVPEQKSWAMASQQQYGEQSLQLKTILKNIIDLPMNVVITAHDRDFKEEGGRDSELIAPSVGPNLSPKVAAWLNGAVEYICQTFIRKEVKTAKSKVGGKEQEISVPTGKFEYCLRVGAHPVYVTGFRQPLDAPELPECIVNPTYEKIAKLIFGE